MNHTRIVSFIWDVADLIRDSFKRGKYQDVILPLTVLRRLDCVLAPTKPKVLERMADLRERGLEDLDSQLRTAAGLATSAWSATRSTSTATSTATGRPARWRRSRPTSGPSRWIS